MRSVARRVLVVVLAVSLVVPWAAAADVRPAVARPRGLFSRLPRARARRAAEACAVQQLLAQARANLDKDEPAAAEKQYSAVLRIEPGNVAAFVGHGTALRQLNRLNGALLACETAIRLDPRNSDAYRARAAVYVVKGDYSRAFADCDEAIRLNPKNSDAYYWRGYARAKAREPKRAIQDLNRAIELNPRDSWAFYFRGAVEHNLGQFDKAISDYSRAMDINPKFDSAYWARSGTWEKVGALDKAVADMSEAIRLKPTVVEYRLARADLYFQANDYDRAIADATEVVRLDPKRATAYCDRSYYYSKKGDADRAMADLTEAIRLDPKYAWSLSARGWMYAKRGDFEKAVADTNNAVKLEPDNPEWYRWRGSVYERKKDKSRARRDFDTCRKLSLEKLLRELGLPSPEKQPKLAAEALEKRIKEQVKSLEYGDEVGKGVVTLVRDWNLVAFVQELDAARADHKRGKLSTLQVVKVEQKTAENLARLINAVIWPIGEKTGGHELTGVVQDKVGCCQGMALLYFVLGNAVGLSVEGLEVDLMAEGASPDGATHVACVAKLSDDSMIMVDTTKQVGHSGFLSKPFHLKVEFRLVGTFWELKNKSNPLGLHQVVQTITADGLIALLDVNRAMELAMKGDLSGAKHYCVKALARDNRSSVVYYCQGCLYGESGRYGDAIGIVSDAIARDPSLAIAYAYRGRCYDQLGKTDLAISDFTKALSLNPKLTLALASRGRCNLTAGKLEQALADANAAVKSNPNDADAYRLRAEIWAGMASHESEVLMSDRTASSEQFIPESDDPTKPKDTGEKNNAVDQKLKLLEANGDLAAPNPYGSPTAPDGKAVPVDAARHASAIKEDYKHVVADLDQVLRLDPKAAWAFSTRGAVHVYLGELDKAIVDCSEAIRLDPKNIKLYQARRAVYETKGDLDKAIADLDAIIRLDPKSADAYKARGDLYAGKHEINKAAADYATAERLKPSDDRYR